MWLVAEYEAVSLFSLRMSSATSSGGKTLLAPSPYAIKIALVDAACRTLGLEKAETLWSEIRRAKVALSPSRRAVVTNLFQRILKPYRNPPEPTAQDFGPFQRVIGYREYVFLDGPLGIGLGGINPEALDSFTELLLQINYLGKRGGFMQIVKFPEPVENLPEGYIPIEDRQAAFPIEGTLQLFDDCSPEVPFERINIFSGQRLRKDDRVSKSVILPYRMIRSSKSFTYYERLDA